MNAKQARELLAALAACDPSGAYAGAQEAVAAVAADGNGSWSVSVRGGDSPAVRARRGDADKRGGTRFSPSAFAEPIASALKAFHELAPIARVQTASKGRWTLVLARPLPWPLFLRCDVSAAYAARSAQLSLVLRDAPVAALEFDGEALWARCGE